MSVSSTSVRDPTPTNPGVHPQQQRQTDVPDIISLGDWLKAQPSTFTTRKRMLVLKDLIYTPTDEKVTTGFRYFRNPVDDLLAAFDAGDLEAITRLTYAIDDEGDVDTSSVCLKLAYTASGSYLAAQPQEYQDYAPVDLREPKVLTSPRGRELVHALDQTN